MVNVFPFICANRRMTPAEIVLRRGRGKRGNGGGVDLTKMYRKHIRKCHSVTRMTNVWSCMWCWAHLSCALAVTTRDLRRDSGVSGLSRCGPRAWRQRGPLSYVSSEIYLLSTSRVLLPQTSLTPLFDPLFSGRKQHLLFHEHQNNLERYYSFYVPQIGK